MVLHHAELDRRRRPDRRHVEPDHLPQPGGRGAHRNLLTAIAGGAELALASLPLKSDARPELDEVLAATQRAVVLTNQLDEGAGFVTVDPVQLEQVLVNLALNAGDAMPGGGTLALSTARVALPGVHPALALPPGDYARLRVEDSGSGIADSVWPHIFEPFFTTKPRDQGTGLGLATVYGIVQQSGGAITVESAPSKGTVFDIFLPSSRGEPRAPDSRPARPNPLPSGAGRTVFLVEDDEQVRRVANRTLSRAGYDVLDFFSPARAIERGRTHQGSLDLLVTDIVMPGMDGTTVASELRRRFPRLRVLYVSGYASEIVARTGVSEEGSGFLAKPFTPSALQEAVGALLAGRSPPQ